MKYGTWNLQVPEAHAVNALVQGGYGCLTAMVLAARGMKTPGQASAYLDKNACLFDPYLMTDMALAAGRIALALQKGETVCVFGDYDVDGITATCLLTEFLRSCGGKVIPYIPGRLEEGYGLNPIAIRQLHGQGVNLIVTVDCGITALEEARLCRELGIDLVITDHHECKDTLPEAIAVVDAHRPDGGYPHKTLSGVGVAFKLACALHGNAQEVLDTYADLVCLGTVADVMLLQGENRVFAARGLKAMAEHPRAGVAALMEECGCERNNLTTSTVGYLLAPRINAAGRMGQIDLALELFLTRDADRARELAQALCALNKERQSVEAEIYDQAARQLAGGKLPEAIVLADRRWHQGVAGIVASRMAEEYCCPTFLICLDGDKGKASSRSYGGFNLFASLTALSPLLESYGGHELAAGFTILESQIPAFRREICAMAGAYYDSGVPRTVLDADCVIPPELLTCGSIRDLSALEPCGTGCPKPVLVMENLTVEALNPVGGGKHLRMWLRSGRHRLSAIYFSATPKSASVAVGDCIDVAFNPQINEFKGACTVQMNVIDIRPHCNAACEMQLQRYARLKAGKLTAEDAAVLLPDRATLGTVWRYLSARAEDVEEDPMGLCRKIVRQSGNAMNLEQMLVCIDVFSDVGLLESRRQHRCMQIHLTPGSEKADLNESATMQVLTQAKGRM